MADDGDTSTVVPGVGESTSAPSGPSSALGSINHLEPIEKHAATESRAEDVGAQVLGSKEVTFEAHAETSRHGAATTGDTRSAGRPVKDNSSRKFEKKGQPGVPKVPKSVRHNMRGTLTSFSSAALSPNSDPILHTKVLVLSTLIHTPLEPWTLTIQHQHIYAHVCIFLLSCTRSSSNHTYVPSSCH